MLLGGGRIERPDERGARGARRPARQHRRHRPRALVHLRSRRQRAPGLLPLAEALHAESALPCGPAHAAPQSRHLGDDHAPDRPREEHALPARQEGEGRPPPRRRENARPRRHPHHAARHHARRRVPRRRGHDRPARLRRRHLDAPAQHVAPEDAQGAAARLREVRQPRARRREDARRAGALTRWLAAAAAVLLAGLAAGTVVYVTAEDDAEVATGSTYVVKPGETNLYRGQLERFGGKMNVLFDQFLRWFDGLWHGKALGVTIVWLGVLLSLAIVVVARFLHPGNQK